MPGTRDNYSDAAVAVAIDPQELAADAVILGEIIDTARRDSHLFIFGANEILVGDTVTLEILESPLANMAGATVAGSRDVLVGQTSINDDNGPTTVVLGPVAGLSVGAKIGYVGNMRYIRLRATVVGLGAGETMLIGAAYLGNHNHQQPVA